MKIASIVGARPQFVKAALLSREFARRGITEYLIHTGQHYDREMSDVFFDQLELPEPEVNLEVGSASHAVQCGEMMIRLDPVLRRFVPDWVLVYGDTNSTLAAALVAAKMHLKVAHVEAGLRSYDKRMPEEINRVVTDHLADLLLAPGENAAKNLRHEGVQGAVEIVGDLMVDLAVQTIADLPPNPSALTRFGLRKRAYVLATIHRAAHTDDRDVFVRLLAGLRAIGLPVVFPVHPRTRSIARACGAGDDDGIIVCEPLPYLDTLALQMNARAVVTDSGGMQKEAVIVGTPCVTMRDRTEWPETLEEGWNVLAGSDPVRIAEAALREPPKRRITPFGGGMCARRIADAIADFTSSGERGARRWPHRLPFPTDPSAQYEKIGPR
jgi:UDP-GlcNAc3NAcA epimerase